MDLPWGSENGGGGGENAKDGGGGGGGEGDDIDGSGGAGGEKGEVMGGAELEGVPGSSSSPDTDDWTDCWGVTDISPTIKELDKVHQTPFAAP